MPADYELARFAIDTVLFTIKDDHLLILLRQREKEPFKGRQELLGGLLSQYETAEQTLRRKLKEALGREDIFFEQFHVFSAPRRDPRQRTVSVGFVALVSWHKAQEIEGWHPCSALPELAFDHREIIASALRFLKTNLSARTVRQFMPDEFPLNALQRVYEIVQGERYDNRNFRKMALSSGLVKESGKSEEGVSHRPARLFRFKGANL